MKYVLLAVLSVPFFFGIVYAQDGETKTKFYDFADVMVNGQYKKPVGANLNARKKEKFKKLSDLKKKFLYRVKESSKDKSLR
jgi:hypothetical protein